MSLQGVDRQHYGMHIHGMHICSLLALSGAAAADCVRNCQLPVAGKVAQHLSSQLCRPDVQQSTHLYVRDVLLSTMSMPLLLRNSTPWEVPSAGHQHATHNSSRTLSMPSGVMFWDVEPA
jgi:hypothetical protein